MVSRRSSKLFWRTFLPPALLMWLIIGLLVRYNISNEVEFRRVNIESQLKNINATLIDAYEHGANLQEVLDFIEDYTNNTSLDNIRVTVFNYEYDPVAHIGKQLLYEDADHNIVPELIEAESVGEGTGIRPDLERSIESMFIATTSNDGGVRVVTAAPYSPSIQRALSYNSMIWMIVMVLGIVATAVIWMFAHRISSSVTTLHTFAQRASAGNVPDIDKVQLTHDEIGDVTREIMRLYADKDRAIKRMKHEHQVAIRANEEKARIKRQTANNLNHEIKTPVGIIKGYLDTILSDPEMPEPLKQSFLEKAQEHADRLTQLLKDVSSITRLEEGAAQVETTNFDFHDLIYNIDNDLEVSDIAGNMRFDWEIPFDTTVRGNYTLLNNAIMNLIRNSAKYSKGTCMKLDLIGEDSSHYTFEFADDGTGVGEEHIPHLFDRFYRVDEGRARKSGGTGLGLPIVKSTFQALGGEITVSNAKPHGLRFVFTLPKADYTPETTEQDSPTPEITT